MYPFVKHDLSRPLSISSEHMKSYEDGKVLFKEDPGTWIAQNPDLVMDVRYLELELSDDVDYLSDFIGRLLNLRRLSIKTGKALKCLPHSLTQLPHLTQLHVQDCPLLEGLRSPLNVDTLTLKDCSVKSFSAMPLHLQRLNIHNCCYVSELLQSFKDGFHSLHTLHIHDSDFEFLPEAITGINTLVSLKSLFLEGCNSVTSVPSLAALRKLETLSLKGCLSLNELPTHFDELTNLSKLYLGRTNIEFLPSSITKLPKLTHLDLPLCFRLETLPNSIDLKFLSVHLPLDFRLDTLPTYFSVKTNCSAHRLCSTKEVDGDSDPEESEQGLINKQTTVNTPFNPIDSPQLLADGHDNPRGGRDCVKKLLAGNIVSQSVSGTDDTIVVCETSKHALESGQISNMATGRERVTEPLDHSNSQTMRKRRKRKITLEDVQQLLSRHTTLLDAAAGLCVSRSTLKRRLKELGINEWPSNRKGNPRHSFEKIKCNTELASISESLQVNSVDRPDQVDHTHTEECPDDANQLMRLDDGVDDATSPITTQSVKKTRAASPSQNCSGYTPVVGTNVIGEANSCITVRTVEDGNSDALTVVSQGGRYDMTKESEDGPARKRKRTGKNIPNKLLKSLMDEGISQEAAAKRLNVSLATLKRYRKDNGFGMWPSTRTKFNADLATGSKPSPLDSAITTVTVDQEHSEHLSPSSTKCSKRFRKDNGFGMWPSTRTKFNADLATGSKPSPLDSAITTVTVDQEHSEHLTPSSTKNTTQCQVCQDTGGFMQTGSVEAPDGRSRMLVVKATYKDDIIRFDFLSTSSLAKLMEEVLARLHLEENKMKIKYQDEDKDWVLLACPADLKHCLSLSTPSETSIVRLKIVDT